jgi:hypothetical protein
LLRLSKRNKSLTIKTHHDLHHSPLLSGYHFFSIVIASLILATCSLNRSSSTQPTQDSTPKSKIQSIGKLPVEISETPTQVVFNQPGNNQIPSLPNVAITPALATPIESLAVPLTPTILQMAATSTPGVFATSDLLFINNNRLLRWDHVTRYSSSLAENVVAFSTNATGSQIVLLRPRGMAANGEELFDLDVLDFYNKQTRHLIQGTSRLLDLALSPDGDWLAYQYDQDGNSAINLLNIADPSTPSSLGQCEAPRPDRCTPPAWSSDSQSLLWSDRRGLWITGVGKGYATLLHTSTVEIPDPQGKTSQIEAQFAAPEWSPTGRFALFQVNPKQSNASWHAVIDTLTGRLGQVLDTYQLSPQQVSVSWLPDGKLAVARSSDQVQQTPATIQVWHVMATNPTLLVSAGEYKLPTFILSSEVTSISINSPATYPLRLNWIQQTNPGHLFFGAIQPDNHTQMGLYDLNLLTKSVTQIVRLTSDIQKILWAPDGSGMLLITSDGKVIFISADGNETFNLISTVGSSFTGFIWLPPTLRR